MFEVEIKLRLNRGERERLKKRLERDYKFLGFQKREDRYYKRADAVLRVRKIGDEYFLNRKIKKIKDGLEFNEESESIIRDIKLFNDFLREQKYLHVYSKTKSTWLYLAQDNINLELNLIENLGYFLEIEKIIEDASLFKLAHSQIMKIVEDLNLENNIEKRSYYELLNF